MPPHTIIRSPSDVVIHAAECAVRGAGASGPVPKIGNHVPLTNLAPSPRYPAESVPPHTSMFIPVHTAVACERTEGGVPPALIGAQTELWKSKTPPSARKL